jgi:Asp-tRNA(Asn)/Glu-tRNA(Gln) amidotransferase A subunit family amidase
VPSSGIRDERPMPEDRPELERRHFLAVLSSFGVAGGLFPGVLWARIQDAADVTPEVVAEAEKVAGIEFTPAERELMVAGLRANRSAYGVLRDLGIPNDVAPAFHFDPTPAGEEAPRGPSSMRPSRPDRVPDPSRPPDVAFASVLELGALLRDRSVTSVQLTELYLDRLRRFDDELLCVVTLTEDLAMEQAARADRELDAGRVRGPVHGIPWGAKDLLAARGYPTTWGAAPFQDQRLETDATVVRKLEAAGAVLVAKLSLGALARGDEWFRGRTRNPWNTGQGSSGSSAGPAAATAAGLVGFSIGSETIGSIVSPSARCGATGLRPTFGRVSRTGAMTLSWTMDKLGPICRSAEDCALVLSAIHGADGLDSSARDVPFEWDGYVPRAFEEPGDSRTQDTAVLDALATLGASPRPVEFPDDVPVSALRLILSVESAASFDALTRSGRDELLQDQTESGWPNAFRTGRLIPAVEYLQANRARTMLIEALAEAWADIDVLVTPSFAQDVILATNLSGHPTVVVPNGFRRDGTPTSISFVGGVWKDAEALHVARAFQSASDYHLRRPSGFA